MVVSINLLTSLSTFLYAKNTNVHTAESLLGSRLVAADVHARERLRGQGQKVRLRVHEERQRHASRDMQSATQCLLQLQTLAAEHANADSRDAGVLRKCDDVRFEGILE